MATALLCLLGLAALSPSVEAQEGLPTRNVRQHWLKTVVGFAGQGTTNGYADVSQVSYPTGIAYDTVRDEIYVAQYSAATIRRIKVLTWEISTYAGTGTSVTSITNGPRLSATFGHPEHLVYDTHYKRLIIGDQGTHHVRGINTVTGAVYTIAGNGVSGSADGPMGTGSLAVPIGVTLSLDNTTVLIACNGNSAVRAAPAAGGGALSTPYGSTSVGGYVNGVGTAARMFGPVGIVTSRALEMVFVTNSGRCIRTIDLKTDYVGHLAGDCDNQGGVDGSFADTRFYGAVSIAMGKGDDALYVSEWNNGAIRRLDLLTKTTTTVAGSIGNAGNVDGPMGTSRVNLPYALTSDYRTGLIFACSYHKIIALGSRHHVKVFAGTPRKEAAVNGAPGVGGIDSVSGLDYDIEGRAFYVASYYSRSIAQVSLAGTITYVAGSGGTTNIDGNGMSASFMLARDLLMDTRQRLLYVSSHVALRTMTVAAPYTVTTVGGHLTTGGAVDGTFGTHRVDRFYQLTHGPDLDVIYFTDRYNHAIRTFHKITKVVTTIAGSLTSAGTVNGAAAGSRFNNPIAIGYRKMTRVLYIGDRQEQLIRTIDMTTMTVATILGTQGVTGYKDLPGADFQMDHPGYFQFTPDEDTLLMSDYYSGCIRVIDVNTLAPREPIGAPGYIGWIAGERDRPTVERSVMTQVQMAPLFDGPAEVARIAVGWSMSKTQPPGVAGVFMADGRGGVILHYTGQGIDHLGAGTTPDRPVESEQWHYNRVVGETTGTCSRTTANGNAFDTRLDVPVGVAVDRPGNAVYTGDHYRYTIRRIDLHTLVSTTIVGTSGVTGTGDGTGATATLGKLQKMLMDDVRRLLYLYEVSLFGLRVIKVDDLTSATAVQLFSGTRGVSGTTDGAVGVGKHGGIDGFCFDGFRTRVAHFWTAETNCLVRRVDGNGAVTTIAGAAGSCSVLDGVGTSARFHTPTGITVSPGRRTAYIVERHSHCLRRMSLATHAVSSIFCTAGAASGKFPGTHLYGPAQVLVSRDEQSLYVAEWQGSTIRRVDLDTWDSELIAGTYGKAATGWDDGLPGQSRLKHVWDMDLDPTTGYLWVADCWTCSIGVVTNGTTTHHISGDPSITTPVGGHTEGLGPDARYDNLIIVAYDPVDNTAYLGSYSGRFDRVDLATGRMTFFAGTGTVATSVAPLSAPRLTTTLGSCYGVHVDVQSRYVYFGTLAPDPGMRAVYRSPIPEGPNLELVGGSGSPGFLGGAPGVSKWSVPYGMESVEGDGLLYVTDRGNNAVRTIDKTTKMSSMAIVGCGIAGTRDGTLTKGCLLSPSGLKYSLKRRGFFLSEFAGATIRFFSFEEDALRTIAGSGPGARIKDGRFLEANFRSSIEIVLAPSEDELFIGSYPQEIARLDLTSGHVTQFVGDYSRQRPVYNGASGLTRMRVFGVGAGPPGELFYVDSLGFKKAKHFVSHHWASSGDSKYTVTSLLGPKYGDDAIRETVAGVVVVPAHDAVYVTLPQRSTIVRVTMTTHAVTEIWGRPQYYTDGQVLDGTAWSDLTAARPSAITANTNDGTLYFAEYTGGRIRSITFSPSVTATLVSGLTSPAGLSFGKLLGSTSASAVFVTDDKDHVVQAVATPSGTISAIAGVSGTSGYKNGAAATALFNKPTGVAFHEPTKSIYVADKGNHLIRRVQLVTSMVTTIAGVPRTAGHVDGGFTHARFDEPFGVAVACPDNARAELSLYVSDAGGRGVRSLDFSTSTVTTMAGRLGFRSAVKDGNGTAARFGTLQGIAAHPCRCGLMYAADATFGRVVEIAENGLQAFLGNATLNEQPHNGRSGTDAALSDPRGIVYDRNGDRMIVASRGFNVVYAVNISTRVPTIIAGRLMSPGTADGAPGAGQLQSPGYMLYVHTTNSLFISDEGARTVRWLHLGDLDLTTLAGAPGTSTPVDGTGAAARFNYPTGLALSRHDNNLLVGDFNAGAIRRIDLGTKAVITVAGQLNSPGNVDGTTSTSKLTSPQGMARHRTSLRVYIACDDGTLRALDEGNRNYLTKLFGAPTWHVDQDGPFSSAMLNHPTDLAFAGNDVDGQETLLYIATKAVVRRVHLLHDKVDTLLGSNTGSGLRHGAFGKTGTIHGLAVDKNEVLYIAHDAGEVSSVLPQLPEAITDRVVADRIAENPPQTGEVVGATFGAYDKRGDYAVAVAAGLPGTLDVVAGGTRDTGRLDQPTGSGIHVKQNAMYVGSYNRDCLLKIDLTLHTITVFSGTPGTGGVADGPAATATWRRPTAFIFRPSEGEDPATMYSSSQGSNIIRTVGMAAPNTVTTIAGDGTDDTLDGLGTAAQLAHPSGIAFDGAEDYLYIVARHGPNVRKMRMSDKMVTLVAGPVLKEAEHVDGVGSAVRFYDPMGIQYRPTNGMFYVSCQGSLRRLDPSTAAVSTIAGFGYRGQATFGPLATTTVDYLCYITIDPHNDNLLYTAEYMANAVSVIDLDKGTRSLIAGTPGTLAGGGTEGPANRTHVKSPWGITIHPTTGEIYFSGLADGYIGKIFRTNGPIPAIRTIAGTPGVNGAAVTNADAHKVDMSFPTSTTYDGKRRVVYVVDHANCRIHEYRRDTKQMYVLLGSPSAACPSPTYIDGPVATAALRAPMKAEYVAATDTLFWVENYRVARMVFAEMITETLAGKTTAGHDDGPNGTSTCTRTVALALTRDVKTMFVVDRTMNSLRLVDLSDPQTPITTLVGTDPGHADGTHTAAKMEQPYGLAMRHSTGMLYITTIHGTVRYYDTQRRALFTLAGVFNENAVTIPGKITNGGPARFRGVNNLVFSYDEDTLFLSAAQLMRLDMKTMTMTYDLGHPSELRCGDGVGVTAGQKWTEGITFAETSLFVVSTHCHTLRQIDAVDLGANDAAALRTTVSTVAGNISGRLGSRDSTASTHTMLTNAQGIAIDQARGVAYVSDATTLRLLTFDRFSMSTLIGAAVSPSDSASCPATAPVPPLKSAAGLLLDTTKTKLFIAEHGGHRVLTVDVTSHSNVAFDVYAGDGTAGSMDHTTGVIAQLNGPTALAWAHSTMDLLVADEFSHAIRSVGSASSHAVTTIAGKLGRAGHKDGTGASAEFDRPAGIAVLRPRRMTAAGAAFVTCRGSHTLRRIDLSTNAVTTVMGRPYVAGIGSGTTGVFFSPGSVSADAAGTGLYVSDGGSRSVKHVFVDDSLGPVESSTFAGYPSSLSDEVAPARDGSREDALFTSRVGQVALLTGAMAGQEGDVAMLVADRGTVRIAFNATSAVTTVAGLRSVSAPRTGDRFHATFGTPLGLSYDQRKDRLYVSSYDARTITVVDLRKGDTSLVAGHSTETGNVQGAATTARFIRLAKLLYDAGNAVLYACDTGAHNIRAIDISAKTVSILAGSTVSSSGAGADNGIGTVARFRSPVCLEFDASREHLLVCDWNNHVIRRVHVATQDVTLLSGAFGSRGVDDGVPAFARFSEPFSIVRRTRTGMFYIACIRGHVIREMDPVSFVVRRIVGTGVAGTTDGLGTAAQFRTPSALVMSPDQQYLYVMSASQDNDGVIRQVDLDVGPMRVTTVAGQSGRVTAFDGPLGMARFGSMWQATIDPTGAIFATSLKDQTIKRITGLAGFGRTEPKMAVTTVAGQLGNRGLKNAAAREALIDTPFGISMSYKRNAVFFSEYATCLVRMLSLDTYLVSTVAGQDYACGNDDGASLTVAKFGRPEEVYVDDQDDKAYVAVQYAAIRRIDLAANTVDTFAGTHVSGLSDGVGGKVGGPSGMQLSGDRSLLYFCDRSNSRIRSVVVATKSLSTLAGSTEGFADGVGTAAKMNRPRGLSRRPGTEMYFFADRQGNAVRIFDAAANRVTTLIGWGPDAGVAAGALDMKPGMWHPTGIDFADEDTLYASSYDVDALWRIDLRGRGEITFAAGTGARRQHALRQAPTEDATDGSKASFRAPWAVTVDRRSGEIYVCDTWSHAIRRVYNTSRYEGYVETVAGNSTSPEENRAGTGLAARTYRPSLGFRMRESTVTGNTSDTEETLLLVERYPGTIRRMWPTTGKIRDLIGKVGKLGSVAVGPAHEVGIERPSGVVVDEIGRALYFTALYGHRVLKYEFATDMVTLVFGGAAAHVDGDQATARVNQPDGLELSADRSILYIASRGAHVIRATTLATMMTSTPYGTAGTAGNAGGVGTAALFDRPTDVCLHRRTNTLYVVAIGTSVIFKINIATGNAVHVAGVAGSTTVSDGPAATSKLYNPSYVAFGVREGIDDDHLYIADESSSLMRRLHVVEETLVTVVGDVNNAHGAHVDGLPQHARIDRIGQPIPMSDGSIFFVDYAASSVRALRFNHDLSTATEAFTSSRSVSSSATATTLPTATSTIQVGGTATISSSVTNSPSGSLPSTVTHSMPATATMSAPASMSATAVASASASLSRTRPSPTMSAAISATHSVLSTMTQTTVVSPTLTLHRTASTTSALTATKTAVASASVSVSPTAATASHAAFASASAIATSTRTVVATRTVSATPSESTRRSASVTSALTASVSSTVYRTATLSTVVSSSVSTNPTRTVTGPSSSSSVSVARTASNTALATATTTAAPTASATTIWTKSVSLSRSITGVSTSPSTSVAVSSTATAVSTATRTEARTASTSVIQTKSGTATTSMLQTASATAVQTQSVSTSRSVTGLSMSPSVSAPSTATATQLASATHSVAASVTLSLAPTATVLPPPTKTSSPSLLRTVSQTAAMTASVSMTSSATAVVSPTVTLKPTASHSAPATSTVSLYQSLTSSSAVTTSASVSASATVRPSATVSQKPTATTSTTKTASASAAVTVSRSVAVTASLSSQQTATSNASVSVSLAASMTNSVLHSATVSLTARSMSSTMPLTPSLSVPPSMTKTPSASASRPVTKTPGVVPTRTPSTTASTTPTPSLSPIVTASLSNTVSPLEPSATASVALSVSSTQSRLVSPTRTAAAVSTSATTTHSKPGLSSTASIANARNRTNTSSLSASLAPSATVALERTRTVVLNRTRTTTQTRTATPTRTHMTPAVAAPTVAPLPPQPVRRALSGVFSSVFSTLPCQWRISLTFLTLVVGGAVIVAIAAVAAAIVRRWSQDNGNNAGQASVHLRGGLTVLARRHAWVGLVWPCHHHCAPEHAASFVARIAVAVCVLAALADSTIAHVASDDAGRLFFFIAAGITAAAAATAVQPVLEFGFRWWRERTVRPTFPIKPLHGDATQDLSLFGVKPLGFVGVSRGTVAKLDGLDFDGDDVLSEGSFGGAHHPAKLTAEVRHTGVSDRSSSFALGAAVSSHSGPTHSSVLSTSVNSRSRASAAADTGEAEAVAASLCAVDGALADHGSDSSSLAESQSVSPRVVRSGSMAENPPAAPAVFASSLRAARDPDDDHHDLDQKSGSGASSSNGDSRDGREAMVEDRPAVLMRRSTSMMRRPASFAARPAPEGYHASPDLLSDSCFDKTCDGGATTSYGASTGPQATTATTKIDGTSAFSLKEHRRRAEPLMLARRTVVHVGYAKLIGYFCCAVVTVAAAFLAAWMMLPWCPEDGTAPISRWDVFAASLVAAAIADVLILQPLLCLLVFVRSWMVQDELDSLSAGQRRAPYLKAAPKSAAAAAGAIASDSEGTGVDSAYPTADGSQAASNDANERDTAANGGSVGSVGNDQASTSRPTKTSATSDTNSSMSPESATKTARWSAWAVLVDAHPVDGAAARHADLPSRM